ncbi:unnamed protein product [Amaranthus hypochondriacus]
MEAANKSNDDVVGFIQKFVDLENKADSHDDGQDAALACNKVAARHVEVSTLEGPTCVGVDNASSEVSHSNKLIVAEVTGNVGQGTTPISNLYPTFELGYYKPQQKKPVKLRKKKNGDTIFVASNVDRENTYTENHFEQNDWAGKRKTWDLDTVMEDSESSLKKYCMEADTEVGCNDTVAEVGISQPRERQ